MEAQKAQLEAVKAQQLDAEHLQQLESLAQEEARRAVQEAELRERLGEPGENASPEERAAFEAQRAELERQARKEALHAAFQSRITELEHLVAEAGDNGDIADRLADLEKEIEKLVEESAKD